LGALKRVAGNFATTIAAPLQVRNFQLLFAGQTISTIGDMFYAVALPWIILTSGGTAQQLGIVLTAYGIPRLGTILLGGQLSDRLRPRRIMLLADAARAVLVALLALVVSGGHPSLLALCVIAVPLGAAAGLFLPPSYSILPDVLPSEQLQAGNALNTSVLQLATLVGAGIGGVVVATLHSAPALLVDAATFVVSAISLSLMQNRAAAPAAAASTPGEGSSDTTEVAAQPAEEKISFGQFLRTSRLLQVTLGVVAINYLTTGGMMEVALPAYAKGPLAAGAGGYGLILAFFGVGALVGGLVAGGIGKTPHRAVVVLSLQAVQAVVFILVPVFGNLVGVIVVMMIAGIFDGLINVLYFTLVQQVFPSHLIGRIFGVIMFATFGLYPLSVGLGGVVTEHIGPQVLFLTSGAAILVAALVGLSQREVREL
jgi:predicted MFS family arabinose efflux permease